MAIEHSTIRLGEGSGRRRLRVPRIRLVVTAGPDLGVELRLDRPVIRVGTGSDCDLALTDPAVSRNHLLLTRRGEYYDLHDPGSTNGTRVNEVLTRDAVLDRDCTILLGSTALTYESVSAEMVVPDVAGHEFHGMLGASRAMRDLFAYLQLIASAGISTVLQGETGSGKELVARAVHRAGPRAAKPFVVFDCSATNPNLVDASLFGHLAGAYTGSSGTRKGAFQSAHEGTLFLDEVGELPLELQPKLLRALERREVQPLGADAPVATDVRILCATHRNLQEMVKEGRFREDLLYRLAGVILIIPPLRERPEDIPLLAEAFLGSLRSDLSFGPDAMTSLAHHPWPGNVRELKNVVERIATFARSPVIGAADIVLGPLRPGKPAPDRPSSLGSVMQNTEAELIRRALRDAGGNQSEAARTLGIARTTLRRKMVEYGIEDEGSGRT